ncbi:hypothetical protein CRYUN_Cryun14cG0137500 [Craigia yunnanensis]
MNQVVQHSNIELIRQERIGDLPFVLSVREPYGCTPAVADISKSLISRGCVTCSAVQELSSPTATADSKATAAGEKEEVQQPQKQLQQGPNLQQRLLPNHCQS